MKWFGYAALSAATFALSGCGHKADTANADANIVVTDNGAVVANDASVAPTPSGGQAFANTAAASDAFEIASSKLALTTSSSPAIKKFAQKMIDAHTQSTDKLKAAAASASPAITPEPALTADQQAKLDALKASTGKAFNQAYIDAQTAGHQQALDALRAYSANGDVPALKSFATTLSPTVAAHLNMAKALKA